MVRGEEGAGRGTRADDEGGGELEEGFPSRSLSPASAVAGGPRPRAPPRARECLPHGRAARAPLGAVLLVAAPRPPPSELLLAAARHASDGRPDIP